MSKLENSITCFNCETHPYYFGNDPKNDIVNLMCICGGIKIKVKEGYSNE